MFLKSPHLLDLLARIGVIGSLDGRRGLAICAFHVRNFFDTYLKNPAGGKMDLRSPFPRGHFRHAGSRQPRTLTADFAVGDDVEEPELFHAGQVDFLRVPENESPDLLP